MRISRARAPAPARGRRSGRRQSSMPTDRRSRSGGAGVPAPSTLARCSTRLSVPPSEVARFHSATCAAVAMAAASPPAHADRQHAAEAAVHLPRRHRMAAARRAGRDRAPPRCADAARSARRCAAPTPMRAHAQVQRAHAAQQQPRLERAERAADLCTHGLHALPEGVVLTRHQHAGDEIGVAVQVLGGRVHHEVGAELERPRQHRRRDGGVDRHARAGRVRECRGGRDVGDRPQRVGRRFDPHQLRLPGLQRRRAPPPGRSCRSARPSGPRRWRNSSASCAATSTSPWAPARGRRAPATGTPRSPPPCRRRRGRPGHRLRGARSVARPDRRPGCRRARRRVRCGTGCRHRG